jgi:hypothetical protein
MAKADSVLSMPPTNTPIDTTRRRLLTVAAGGAMSIAAGSATALPAAIHDPIYAAIERHKETAAIWDTVVTARSGFNNFDMTDEQQRQRNLLEDAEHAAWEACDQAGIDLVTTEPTTPAGIIAAIRYVQIQIRDDIYMPTSMQDQLSNGVKYEGDSPATLAWVDAYLDTIASATAALDKAVQS